MKILRNKIAVLLSAMAGIAVFGSITFAAGGLKTEFGEISIENLGIGQSYNLREYTGKPFRIVNSGDNTVQLIMDVQITPEDWIHSDRREAGYKPIPSVDWIKLSQAQFVVPPNESAFTDITLSIPNDPSLYGKKFQATIYSHTMGKDFLQLALFSYVVFTITESSTTQNEIEKNKKMGFIGNLNFSLQPDRIVLENFPVGRSVDILKEFKKTIRIANSGEEPIELLARIVPVGDSPLSLQTGFEESKVGSLSLKSEKYNVPPLSFSDLGFHLEYPNDSKLSGKKFMYVIKVTPADPKSQGLTYYGKIYIVIK